MATVGLYGSSSSGVVAAASGSESTGLYGNSTSFGGSYFEWFIFQVADIQPATPTGGSWDFSTNSGVPPTGWTVTPPSAPTNTVWVSIALVNSKTSAALTWSAPGKFSYASGLPILSGSGTPGSGVGQSDQLYIQLDTTPQTIWFKETGTWTRLTGSSLYVDLTSNQTIAGTKTFSSQIQGSVSGTAANVTGIVAVANGGTGVTTSTGSGNVVLSNAPTLNNPTISNYEAFALSSAPAYSEGVVWYDSASNALAYYNNTTNNVVHIGQEIQQQVRNSTGVTITKGQVVYISGSTGQIGNVILAQANAYISSQVIGVANQDIPNNTNGWIVTQGTVTNINTSGFTAGNSLYLSATTAGAMTQTEPNTPNYAVHMGVCLYSNTNNGKIYICPINKSIDTGYIIGQVAVAQGGTGTSTPSLVAGTNVSITGTWPNQTINSSNPGGTVTSVAATVPSFLSVTGSPITNSGTLAIGYSGTALPVLNGGTGVTTSTGSGSVVLNTSPTLVTPALGTPTSGNFSTGTFTWPTFNQNTTGTASNVTGTVAIANGGTGATTAATARTNLGATTVGGNLFTLTNPSAITFPQFNADNTVSALTASAFRTAIGAGTSSTTGTVTSVAATVPAFLSISGSPITSSGTLAISLSGTALPTANGGTGLTSFTANGVVYASGAGTLATGSALTFDGTSFGNTGPINGTQFNVSGASSATNGMWGAAGAALAWNLSSTELMRLTSTGLGIGTSSPGAKLHVLGSARQQNVTDGSDTFKFLNAAGGTLADLYGFGTSYFTIQSGSNIPLVYNSQGASGVHRWQVNSSDVMRLDSSGNLGLGVTPSAWSSTWKALQIGSSSFSYNGFNDTYMGANWRFDGTGDKYINSDFAGLYAIVNGSHQWLIAPSGTAGNAISFTQAMTLTATGNFLVGSTTDSGSKLQVGSSSGSVATPTAIELDGTYASSDGFNKLKLYLYKGASETYGIGLGGLSDMQYWAGSSSTGAHRFFTSQTERARIDSSGNLLVGTTSAAGKITIAQTASSAVGLGVDIQATSTKFCNFTYQGSTVGSISYNGTLTVYATTSDQRVKHDIVDAPEASGLIDAIKVRSFKWNADNSEQRYGFIAQELVTVAPEAVHQPADPEEMMAVDYSKLVPMLVKEIQSLRARVAQLEGK